MNDTEDINFNKGEEYAVIDSKINDWIQKRSLKLTTMWAGEECRSTYVSSIDGKCFQIWINKPIGGVVCIGARYVDGPIDIDFSYEMLSNINEFDESIDKIFSMIISLMHPYKQYVP